MRIGSICQKASTSVRRHAPLLPLLPLPPARRQRPAHAPPKILSARASASSLQQHLARDPSRSGPVSALLSLPSISLPLSSRPLQHVSKLSIQVELKKWRAALSSIHRFLLEEGPRGNDEWRDQRFGNKLVRVVAHTMRLLASLGHWTAVKELDRAFFSSETRPTRTTYVGKGKRKRKEVSLEENFVLGDGVGLERGAVRLAWMQSLKSRASSADLDEFVGMVKELKFKSEEKKDAGIDVMEPIMTAFLIRTVGHLATARGQGSHGDGEEETRAQLDSFLVGLQQGDHRHKRESVVQIAILETKVIRLEQDVIRGGKSRSTVEERLDDLESGMKHLLVALQQDGVDVALLQSAFSSPPPSETTSASQTSTSSYLLPSLHQTSQQTQALHLAIRILLLRHQLSPSSQSVTSSLALYRQILSLLQILSRSPNHLSIIRPRQKSSFIRIVNEFMTTLPFLRSPSVGTPSSGEWDTIDQVLDVVRETLSTISSLPPSPPPSQSDPRPLKFDIGVSSELWDNHLSLLSYPTLHHTVAPFHLLLKSLRLLADCRAYDLSLACEGDIVTQITEGNGTLRRKSLLFQLIRSALLSPPFDSSTPISQLESLVSVFESLERGGDPVRKRTVAAVFDEIVLEEWPGFSWRSWRRQLRAVVKAWAKDEWWAGQQRLSESNKDKG